MSLICAFGCAGSGGGVPGGARRAVRGGDRGRGGARAAAGHLAGVVRALFLWRTMAPEVADACQRVFYHRRSSAGGGGGRARAALEATGAKAVLQPPSLRSSEIKVE